MNIALITAAGIATRMHQAVPKQFLEVYDKPIVIYTLEAFQKHPDIDAIVVVCLEGWETILQDYCKQFKIDKLESIVCGGENSQDSIRNGLYDIASRHSKEDLVIVHDGNRPMVSQDVISDCIQTAYKHRIAVAAIPCIEAILKTSDGLVSVEQIERDGVRRTQTPHGVFLGDLLGAHEEARQKGITASVATCTLYIELGRKVYFSQGAEKNIKITTPEDLEIFKAFLNAERDNRLS